MENKSFRPDFSNPHQNAVVGEYWNGDLDYAYREGFKQATMTLLAAATSESYFDPNTDETVYVYVDALVYPICFNARHFIELFLKDSIRTVSALGSNAKQIDVDPIHTLSTLWGHFAAAIARDSRLMERGMPLEEVFKDIADVDNTSMTFRYSRDLADNVHLSGHQHINLGVLGDRLRDMFKQAEEFSVCLTVLQQEYAQGTFTAKLHRANIEDIAKRLPPYEKWTEELNPVKEAICNQLKLSSNDFGKALNLIKRHREFSALIGLELPLEGLPEDVFTRLARVHAGEAAHDVITKDEWLRLDAVMEINRLDSYSEEYDRYLKRISAPDYEGSFSPESIARNAYARNQRLYGGLVKLGQRTLLASLAEAIPHLAEPMKTPPKHTDEEISALTREIFSHFKCSRPGSEAMKGDEPGEG
ncbi:MULTISPECIES: hypothetical protein [Methylomonas]|uniref:Uncharacterized protein n=2 Tax=Methylomonas TaxID=416 RepID=A0A126T4D7_9GAMM|nr:MULTISPECIES: hypothetical protein [Methylomonas]AMK76922.1 hypothetical protein JT25_010555 [Methylomonas denitrificans]OAH96737.1 hypothetical protein A1342_21855 [Methylomonas methanica]TCV73168.1 hypothetical protein EDE11_14414 [Methylomonas methanica]